MACCSACSRSSHQHHRAAARRVVLARARGHLRHPPSRRRAARRVRVRRQHRGVPLALVGRALRRRRQRAHHVGLLRADPVGPRRHPARPGTRRHPRARRPAEAREEARARHAQGAARRSRGGQVHGGRRARARAAPTGRREPASAPPTARSTRRRRLVRDRGIVAGYGDAEVLHGVDLRLDRGQDHRAARRQRRRQVDAVLGRRGLVEATLGTVHPRGTDITTAPPYQPRPRRRAAGARSAWHLPRTHRRGEPHGQPPRREAARRRPTSGSRSSPSGGSSRPACSRAASSRCSASPPCWPTRRRPHRRRAHARARAARGRGGDASRSSSFATLGCAVLLVEEHAQNALAVADTLVFMELGHVVWSGAPPMPTWSSWRAAYLGTGR